MAGASIFPIPLLASKYEDQYEDSASPHQLFNHRSQEIILNALQKPSALLMPCCVGLPADIWVVKVPYSSHPKAVVKENKDAWQFWGICFFIDHKKHLNDGFLLIS